MLIEPVDLLWTTVHSTLSTMADWAQFIDSKHTRVETENAILVYSVLIAVTETRRKHKEQSQ